MPTPPSELAPAASVPVVLDDERAIWLSTLYEANIRSVLKTCRRLLDDPEDAADAAQEVFLRAATSLHTAPDGKDASAWLTTVARNYCLDLLRRRRKFKTALTTLGAGIAVIEADTTVVDRQLAQKVLDQLAVRDRQALWESHVEERSVGEIAERFGLNYLATAQLLHRARRRAALVAAELAALLALIRLGMRQARTQIPHAAQPIAAVVLVPVAVVGLIAISRPPTVSPAPVAAAPRHAPVQALNPSPIPTAPPATNPNTGLPPPAPAATAPAITQQPVVGQVLAAQAVAPPVAPVPSPAPRPVVSAPKPSPKPTGPPWKKGHHKLGNHGHGHSAS